MEELKAQESEALDILEAMLDVCDLDNPGPMFAGQHVRGGICKIMDDDVAKLRQYIAARRAAPENKPLTLEQLRKMDGEPVWVKPTKGIAKWYLVDVAEEGCADCDMGMVDFELYGSQQSYGWLAYASKPEGSENI